MVQQQSPGFQAPPSGDGGWLNGMLGQMGLPNPQALLGELQRLNGNLEAMAPDLKKIAAASAELNPQDIRNLASALQSFQERMWGRT